MLENVSVDVVDGARVKCVFGCPSVPGGTEGVNMLPTQDQDSGPFFIMRVI